jgi:hypothetical protein
MRDFLCNLELKSLILFSMDLAMIELKTIQWTLTCLSVAASMLFALLSCSSKKPTIIPVINLFVSSVMTMYYFYTAVVEIH